MNLSPHFTLAELCATQHRQYCEPNALYANAHGGNLRRLACDLLEPVRELLGNVVMVINSGIRCPGLNAAVGSGPRSAHLHGLAVDFIAPDFGPPYEICRALAGETCDGQRSLASRGVAFDQLIYEHTWVHLALARVIEGVEQPPRGEVLTLMCDRSYAQGIILRGAA